MYAKTIWMFKKVESVVGGIPAPAFSTGTLSVHWPTLAPDVTALSQVATQGVRFSPHTRVSSPPLLKGIQHVSASEPWGQGPYPGHQAGPAATAPGKSPLRLPEHTGRNVTGL